MRVKASMNDQASLARGSTVDSAEVERFARIATIAGVLACETPAEAAEAAKGGADGKGVGGARLSPEDIASIVKQRVDWR